MVFRYSMFPCSSLRDNYRFHWNTWILMKSLEFDLEICRFQSWNLWISLEWNLHQVGSFKRKNNKTFFTQLIVESWAAHTRSCRWLKKIHVYPPIKRVLKQAALLLKEFINCFVLQYVGGVKFQMPKSPWKYDKCIDLSFRSENWDRAECPVENCKCFFRWRYK